MSTTTTAHPRTKSSTAKTAAKAAPKAASKKSTSEPVAVKPVAKTPVPKALAKAAPANPPAAALTETMQPVVASRQMRHKELADRVAARTGMKKKDVKPVIQATLAVMGEVLGEQRGLILPPLGRVKLQRAKEVADGRVLVLKLRQKFDQQTPATPAAD